VRRETSFNGGCTQFSAIFPSQINGSEDCLYLNIWRPQDGQTGLPVYVWIHGGGNSTGSSTLTRGYFGDRIAARSHLVFVSVNYRLGPFGWFTLPALRQDASVEDASGNFGTLDIVQSLKWIRQNIQAFGGDPNLVTVTGESAGGIDVLSLLISPSAHGLFQHAMSESGAALTHSLGEADAKAQDVLELLLLKDGKAGTRKGAANQAAAMSGQEVREYLKSKSDRQILSVYKKFGMGMIENPTILRDGAVIPLQGYEVLRTEAYANKVPVILGSNSDELTIFLRFGSHISWRNDLFRAASRYGSARWKVSGVDEVARRLVAHPDQPPVYAYQFRWGTLDPQGNSPLPGTWGSELGAFHSLDIPFFLGNDSVLGVFQIFLFTWRNEPGRKALSASMMRYLARFARTGDPNMPGENLPEWEPWSTDRDGPKYIIFDTHGDAPTIMMSNEELTDQEVMDAARQQLPEPLRTRTLRYLETSPLPSGVQ
jgi:para-nitrobenzyl esterase